MNWALLSNLELTPNEREGATGAVFLLVITGAVMMGWIWERITKRK